MTEAAPAAGLVGRLRAIPSWQVAFCVALLTLGFLIAAQLRSQAPTTSYSSNERAPLIQTARGLQDRQNTLKAQILDLRTKIQDAEKGSQGNEASVRELNTELQQARIAAGLVALSGPGIVLQLQDSTNPVPPGGNQADYLVNAGDLRTVVDQLWLAGAEAISINGERVVTTTAILDIGGSILVNSSYLSAPYQVSAIGPPDLFQVFNSSVGVQDLLRARAQAIGIRFGVAELPDVAIPAYAGTVGLRYTRPAAPQSASPAPSGGPSSAPPSASSTLSGSGAATPVASGASSVAAPSATP